MAHQLPELSELSQREVFAILPNFKGLADIIFLHLNVLPAAAADVLEAVLAFLAGGVATVSGSSSSLTTITSSDSARDGGRPRPTELSH